MNIQEQPIPGTPCKNIEIALGESANRHNGFKENVKLTAPKFPYGHRQKYFTFPYFPPEVLKETNP